MGCWNHSCAVTGLPIFVGEEVEVIILTSENNPDASSRCYPNSYHTPIPLTFHGRYNDYGAVEECDGVALPFLINAIRERLFEMEEGENEYHDIPAKRDEFNVDKLFELDHENRLMITNYKMQSDMRDAIPLKHIVVRKNVYDTIVAKYKLEYWDREDQKTKFNQLKDVVLQYDEFLKDIDEAMNIDEILFAYRVRECIGKTVVGELLSFRGMATFGFNRLITPNEVIVNMCKTHNARDVKEFMDNVVRFALFTLFMSDTRRSWCVSSGVGSQNDDTNSHEMAARLTLDEAETIKHRWDDLE